MNQRRPARRAATALAVLLSGVLAALPAGAWADPGKGPADPAHQPATGRHCSLRSSAGHSTHDEWLSCLGVQANLDRLPAVGETATLSVTVTADAALDPTDISIELPTQFTWVQAPKGLTPRQVTGRRPERAGKLAVADGRRQLRAGERATYTGVVKAVGTGAAQISARATAGGGDEVQAGQDDVFVTVAAAGQRSVAGGTKAGPGATAPGSTAPERATRPEWQRGQSVGTAGLAKPSSSGASIAAACDTRVTGNFGYYDQNSTWHNSMNLQVQVWDDEVFSDTLLASGLTDWAGNYNLCFDGGPEDWPDSGTADVYVKVITENNVWKVQNGGALTFQTGTTSDVPQGSTLNLGSLTAGDGTMQRGLHAFDEANDAWLWIPKPTNVCFDQDDAGCRQLVINWGPSSTDGTYYSTGSNDVHLAADDPNAAMTVVHEIGHAVMDDVYNDSFPSAPSCNPHTITGTTSTGCAWTEGWAEWFPATVYNDPYFRWPSGSSLNLEAQGRGDGRADGDTTEGRVAGALIDITDYAYDGYWDSYGEGSANLWSTFMRHVDNTFGQFWSSRASDGYNVADAGALASVYQNTIDYGYREPLGVYAPLNRPTPSPAQNYGYWTTTNYWSAVAVRPAAGADYDVALYDDRGQGAYLAGSTYGGSYIDFVAVDSNLRAMGDYYPRASAWAGTGNYAIELAHGSVVLNTGSSTLTMYSGNVVAVRDTYLTAGVPVTLTVTPTNSGQDPELFLMGDDPANSATFVRGRASASATAASYGSGAAETLTYTPTRTGWFGVVVTNKVGSGNYTLTRS